MIKKHNPGMVYANQDGRAFLVTRKEMEQGQRPYISVDVQAVDQQGRRRDNRPSRLRFRIYNGKWGKQENTDVIVTFKPEHLQEIGESGVTHFFVGSTARIGEYIEGNLTTAGRKRSLLPGKHYTFSRTPLSLAQAGVMHRYPMDQIFQLEDIIRRVEQRGRQ